jgi:hypothetical protein
LFESCDFADNFKAFWEEKGASIMQACSSLKLEVCTTELTTKGYEAGRKLIMKIWNVAFQTTSTQGSRRSNQPAIFINKAGTAYDSTRPDIATCDQPAGVSGSLSSILGTLLAEQYLLTILYSGFHMYGRF